MRCLFLILSLFVCSCVNAQTKKETEEWIISKINKYKETEYSGEALNLGFSTKISSVKFTECKFVIVQLIEGVRTKNPYGTEKFTQTITLTFPINKLSEIYYGRNNKTLHLNTINDEILWKTNDPLNPSNNETIYVNFIIIPINLNAEKDLFNRITKAFNYLRDNYCKKEEQPKEVF